MVDGDGFEGKEFDSFCRLSAWLARLNVEPKGPRFVAL